MRILVTGGSGMVGRALLAHPWIRQQAVSAPRRSELDLRDRAALQRWFGAERPEVILHLAARVGGIDANRRANAEFLSDNVLTTTLLLEAAAEAGIGRVLNFGSSCMYPKDRQERLSPEALLTGPLEPTNEGYALAKLVGCRLAEFWTRQRPDLSFKTLVPSNLYGPGDKFDPLHAHLIPAAIRKVHEAKRSGGPIEIWGDGSARREFLYVDDLLALVVLCLQRWEQIPGILNAGYGDDFSVLEYYQMTCEALGCPPRFEFSLGRPVGMQRKLLDSSAAFALGWRPQVPPREGIARTYAAMREALS